MPTRWTLLAVAWAAGCVAHAAEVAGVKLEDHASVGGQQLVLNGAGLRTRAVFKVYVGSLYLPEKATTPQSVLAKGPRRIQLNLLRNLSADQLVDALIDGLKDNNAPAELEAIKAQTDELVRIMKSFGDVKEGSVVTLDFVDGATRIGQDGTAKGSIQGEAFNRALTRIWLGDRPVQADLKKAMLGGS
jgi:carbonic anhydrase/acetyltransferase-like protein (isoleucine patch superfamily)